MNNDLSAAEAARILGISRATLYSYVSRGWLRPCSAPANAAAARSKRYPHEAVLRLAARKADAKRGGHLAAGAMNWGLPVLETQISRIAEGRLHYRAHDALALAGEASLETVASILWDDAQGDHFSAPVAVLAPGVLETLHTIGQGMAPHERALALLPVLAQAAQPSAQAAGPFASGALLMRLLAGLLLEQVPCALPLHGQVAQAWGVDARQAELIRATLVLLADHELNTSTFTVRCVASTGASLAAALSAGLAALSGPGHGGGCAAARRMLDAALCAPSPMAALVALAATPDTCAAGAAIEGYGHPLYPQGDPRAGYLLAQLALDATATPRLAAILALCSEGARLTGQAPNADLALAALELAGNWPAHAGSVLFALARSAGWIAHAVEQAATGVLIRPRSRYVGRYFPGQAPTGAHPGP